MMLIKNRTVPEGGPVPAGKMSAAPYQFISHSYS